MQVAARGSGRLSASEPTVGDLHGLHGTSAIMSEMHGRKRFWYCEKYTNAPIAVKPRIVVATVGWGWGGGGHERVAGASASASAR